MQLTACVQFRFAPQQTLVSPSSSLARTRNRPPHSSRNQRTNYVPNSKSYSRRSKWDTEVLRPSTKPTGPARPRTNPKPAAQKTAPREITCTPGWRIFSDHSRSQIVATRYVGGTRPVQRRYTERTNPGHPADKCRTTRGHRPDGVRPNPGQFPNEPPAIWSSEPRYWRFVIPWSFGFWNLSFNPSTAVLNPPLNTMERYGRQLDAPAEARRIRGIVAPPEGVNGNS